RACLREFLLANSLKIELQSELDLSRCACRQRITEAAHVRGGDGIDVIRIKLQGRRLGTDRAKLSKQEVRVVEDIEEFRPEFEMHLLANRKLLDQRSIPSLVARALDDVPSGVAERSENIVIGKGAGVEQRPGDARSAIRIANQVGA